MYKNPSVLLSARKTSEDYVIVALKNIFLSALCFTVTKSVDIKCFINDDFSLVNTLNVEHDNKRFDVQ